MSTELILVLIFLGAGAIYLVMYIRQMMRRSEAQWQAADKDKLRTWDDEEDEERD
ncbi:hypothetical protein [Lentisalinibacter salinarum]|uniref:hypothetical protein n=1 Tax=Lentisalinibacter salinarum TaxID=2992239 RepID=UPI003869C81B